MLKNYFLTAIRRLSKNRETSIINIAGLSLGIACLLVIMVVVRYELSFDNFHSQASSIYRIVAESVVNGETQFGTGVHYPLPASLKSSLSTISDVTAMQYEGGRQISVYNNESGEILRKFQEDEGFVFVDSSFFEVFDFGKQNFHWIAGDSKTALTEQNSLVLTESLAKKYFQGENALGKIIKVDNRTDYKITGVVSDLPENTDFPFQIFASYETFHSRFEDIDNDWQSLGQNQCYVVLKDGVSPIEVENQILAIHNEHLDQNLPATFSYHLQTLQDVHTDSRYGNFKNRTISWQIIISLVVIGVFLIITAIINFVNLTTAQAVLRTKEVCVRKIMGSDKIQLVTQFLGETFVITSLAGLLALGLAELAILNSHELLQVSLQKALILDPFIWAALTLIIFVVTVLAGVYPAFVMSRFNPVNAIRNKSNFGLKRGINMRWGLVTLQFVIAQVFIVGTLVVIKQMDYFRNMDLGFSKEAILTLQVPADQLQNLQSLKSQWLNMPNVEKVSLAYTVPSGEYRWGNWQFLTRKGVPESEGVIFENQPIDENYLDLYQIPLIAGRNFVSTDTMKSMLINRSLSERLGFKSPEEALGETLMVFDQALEVVGVTEDFHTKSLKENIDYVAFVMKPQDYRHVSVKLNLGDDQIRGAAKLKETVAELDKTWTSTFPEYVFDYHFLDQSIEAFYREENRISKLFQLLAGITIFIGCLGLYGLVAFMAVRRAKEVGIRKVLGATIPNILTLFSKEFVGLVLVAFIIAGPIAYFMMQKWLQNFEYKISIGVGVFAGAIAASLLIALVTVSYQSLKAALANPVESLKTE